MLKFIRKVSYFLIAYIVVVGLFFMVVPAQYTTNYTAGIMDKVQRLETTKSPKIILVGNSNLAFGMVSEEIEKAMGMPVVNLGYHGGFGNIFHENMAKRNIGNGDIVILCHSNYSDEGKMFFREEFWFAMENHFELWDIPGAYGILENAYNLPRYMVKCTKQFITGEGNDPNLADITVYARSNLNEYGDIKPEAHTEIDTNTSPNLVGLPSINDTCINRINEFNDYCEERGATLLIAGYPIADTYDRPSDEQFNEFQSELESRVNCPVISTYTDYIFSTDYFNGLALHMNDKGAELRTKQLIEDLLSWKSQG